MISANGKVGLAFRRLARLLVPRSVRDRIRPRVLKESPTPEELARELAVAEEIRRQREHAETLRSLMETEPWCVDTVTLERTALAFSGWTVSLNRDPSAMTFLACARVPEFVDYPRPPEDIREIFWFLPEASLGRFCCRIELTDDELTRPVAMEFVDRATLRPFSQEQNHYYLPDAYEVYPVPDALRRRRVVASDSESGFLLQGFTTFVKLGHALERSFGRSYGTFERILDWGCGCGRVTRYLSGVGASVTGADIDRDNVDWCRRHLSFGRFEHIPLRPPTSFADASFDLIFGISVFTHLGESDQREWLAELHRIAAPGAVLLMSTQGRSTMARLRLPPDVIGLWKENGFLDVGANRSLAAVLGENRDYYRDALHTTEYIRANWTRHFSIVDVIPGYIGNLQDLVIMRKSSGSGTVDTIPPL